MAGTHTGSTGGASRVAFSADGLPAGVDACARLDRWYGILSEFFGAMDVAHAEDQPFWARFDAPVFGAVSIRRYQGTLTRVERTPGGFARDGRDEFILGFNLSSRPFGHSQRGREAPMAQGAAVLIAHPDAWSSELAPGTLTFTVGLPRRALLDRVADAEDRVARMLSPDQPALAHLKSYLGILLGPDGPAGVPVLSGHVETTLLDLAGLALGAGRDAAEIARMRGLRAARLEAVLAGIGSGFAEPGFSARALGERLGLSPRYIQDLLHETGTGFAERVLELRLQKARKLLASPAGAHRHISQIAYACGFNNIAYFNRVFRRRFSETPTAARVNAFAEAGDPAPFVPDIHIRDAQDVGVINLSKTTP